MNTTLKFGSIVAIFLFVTLSFAVTPSLDVNGKYGDEIMQLTLNEDYTFSYFRINSSENKDEATGKWEIQNGKVVLTNIEGSTKIPKKWIVLNRGKTIKTRKNLTFYTLHKECK